MADDPLVIETGVHAPDTCVIWLHGLGADGHDFEPIVPELRLDPGLNIRFVFPHAPMMPVTINQGFVMRAWFDIRTADISAEADEKGIRASAEMVSKLVDAEITNGIAPERIVLAGFSQGGAIVPILLAHGSADPVVPVALAYETRAALENNGYEVEWHEYKGMAHSVSEQEIFHLAEWLEKILI
jgi:phospholipase/carboxylesterase